MTDTAATARPTPSVYDVAREAGVSPATVSRAMNHPDLVNEITRERVIKVARRLGYRPREDAELRRRGPMPVIGTVGPFTSEWSAERTLVGILQHARGLGAEIVVYDSDLPRLTLESVNRLFQPGRVDGLIVAGLPTTTSALGQLREQGLPVLTLGVEQDDLPSVSVDQDRAARVLVDFIAESSVSAVLVVGLDPEEQERAFGSHALRRARQSQARVRAVTAQLRIRGARIRSDAIIQTSASMSEATRSIAAALRGRTTPIAVITTDDELATAALRAASIAGLSVPREVSVIGYGDTPVAQSLGITSVHEPLQEAGALALEVMLELQRGQHVAEQSRLQPTVAVRSSAPLTGRRG